MCRAHGRICRCYDRHKVSFVTMIDFRIPYSDLKRSVFDVLQKDRLWPTPLTNDAEELVDDSRTCGLRI